MQFNFIYQINIFKIIIHKYIISHRTIEIILIKGLCLLFLLFYGIIITLIFKYCVFYKFGSNMGIYFKNKRKKIQSKLGSVYSIF